MKHGILARAVVVHTDLSEDTHEDQAEFDAIFVDLMAHYSPDGPIEAMLCEKIAVAYWRLRRVLWFEGSQIAAGVTRGTEEALAETEELEDEAADLQSRADRIRQTGRLSKEELQLAREHLGRKSVDPETWASMLIMWATRKEQKAETYYTRKTQQKAAPNFSDDRMDTVLRYEAHLNRQLHKDIQMLEHLQAARVETATNRKPRRGASRSRPKYLHVVNR